MRTNCHGSDGFRTMELLVKLDWREIDRERERAFHARKTCIIMKETEALTSLGSRTCYAAASFLLTSRGTFSIAHAPSV